VRGATGRTSASRRQSRRQDRRADGVPAWRASAGISRRHSCPARIRACRACRAMLLAVELLLTCACGDEAVRRGATVLFASGADLQSINPLLTLHPLAPPGSTLRVAHDARPLRLTARGAALPRAQLALVGRRTSAGRSGCGRTCAGTTRTPTTARDVVWTLQAARDPATGYPRFTELQTLTSVVALDDSTVALRFSGAAVPRAGADLPTSSPICDLACAPARQRARRAAAGRLLERPSGGQTVPSGS